MKLNITLASIQLVSGISNESLERLRVNAWLSQHTKMLAIHVVNYNVPIGLRNGDQVKILNNITLQIALPPTMHAHSVFYHSPDSESQHIARYSFLQQLVV